MQYHYIPRILENEGGSEFQSVHQRWRPQDLFLMRQIQLILKDMAMRQQGVEQAEDEFKSLEYAAKYIEYTRKMRLAVRQAHFSWRADHLQFLKAVADFYSDYGALLRLLRMDQLRGKFSEPASAIGA